MSVPKAHVPHTWPKRGTLRTKSKESCMALAFSFPDSSLLASGNFSGDIVVWDTYTLTRVQEMNLLPLEQALSKKQQQEHAKLGPAAAAEGETTEERRRLPITSLTFRPVAEGMANLRQILLATTSSGLFVKIDALTGEVVGQPVKEENNEIFAAAYSPSGALFATAGRDGYVRIYKDSDPSEPVKKFTIAAPSSQTSNSVPQRVFSLSWPDETTVLAAGWSSTVVAFDIKHEGTFVDQSARKDVFGPFITGNAMCLVPRVPHGGDKDSSTFMTGAGAPGESANYDIFCASYRTSERLQLFDPATMMKTAEIAWPAQQQQFLPLCAASANGFLAFGGGGGHGYDDGAFVIHAPSADARQAAAQHAKEILVVANEDRHQRQAAGDIGAATGALNSQEDVLHKMKEHLCPQSTAPLLVELKQPEKPIMACAFATKSSQVAFGDSEGIIHVFEPSRRH